MEKERDSEGELADSGRSAKAEDKGGVRENDGERKVEGFKHKNKRILF